MSLKTYNLVFIGGVHGTGKGQTSTQICLQTDYKHIVASDLLKWAEYSFNEGDKRVNNIPETQERLLMGIEQKCSAGNSYLLDGHYTLLDRQNVVTKIQIETFMSINPSALILKNEDAHVIRKRLQERDNKIYELSLIDRMLMEERNHFYTIAKALKVPNLEIKSDNFAEVLPKIMQLL